MTYLKPKKHTWIIAEVGVNHNGSERIARKLIDVAKKSGADAVKFQLFSAENIILEDGKKPNYIRNNVKLNKKSQFQILKDLELSFEAIKRLKNYSKKKKIEFLISPFDNVSIDRVIELKLKNIKIPSGEINNFPYLEKISKFKKKIILSTGMATMNEVENAIKLLTKYKIKKNDITVLHCTTDYPTKPEDVNLKAMITIKEKLNVKVGYSDHTSGYNVTIAAVANGAEVIEKHITLDKKMLGPDHSASLDPNEFTIMVKAIRELSEIFGSGLKKPSKGELKNIYYVRKSIVAKKNIKKGEIFTDNNLTTKRPGTGINPMKWKKIIGRKSKHDYIADQLIKD